MTTTIPATFVLFTVQCKRRGTLIVVDAICSKESAQHNKLLLFIKVIWIRYIFYSLAFE